MKLTVCMAIQNCQEWISMSLRSAMQHADEIIIMDDMSTDNTKKIIDKIADDRVKYYKQDFGRHFGNQRQAAYEKATGDWILWLDSDEALSDDAREAIDHSIATADDKGVCGLNIRYIHLLNNLDKIDNSEGVHLGILRLHRNLEDIKLTRVTHALPEHIEFTRAVMDAMSIVIFHLGYAYDSLKNYIRFKRNIMRSTIHSPVKLLGWRDWRFGKDYPSAAFDPNLLPEQVKQHFKLGNYDIEELKSNDDWPIWADLV